MVIFKHSFTRLSLSLSLSVWLSGGGAVGGPVGPSLTRTIVNVLLAGSSSFQLE